ncbi:MAG: transglycosylase SLT domain-containing protein, partial [Pyrinomonadaceae bacterium]
AFNGRGVPRVVGVYLCVIETEYHNIESENFAGAAGLFQFIGPTAEAYGVPRAERTNVEKMAPAAAAYISDRIAEFGTDSMSVALGIAGYNRNPDSVRRDLRDVLDSENKERSFWTLVVNSTKLDHYFQGENIKYVPKFFAAAIVGENHWAFGLEGMQPLSTYDAMPIKQAARPEPQTSGTPLRLKYLSGQACSCHAV